MVVDSLLSSFLDDFPCVWHHFFEHGFYIDLSLMLGWFLTSFLMFF